VAIADRLNRPAVGGDPLQLSLRKEADLPAVRRPEGTAPPLGPGQPPDLQAVERTDPEGGHPSLVPNHEDDAPAVGSERYDVHESETGRWRQREADHVRCGLRPAGDSEKKGGRRDRGQERGDRPEEPRAGALIRDRPGFAGLPRLPDPL